MTVTAATTTPENDGFARGLLRARDALQQRDARGHMVGLQEAAHHVTAAHAAQLAAAIDAATKAFPAEADAALVALSRAEERAGALPALLHARANVHERAGHVDAALTVVERHLAVDSTDPDLLERAGDFARKANQPTRALIHYQAAFRIDRARPTTTMKACQVYLELSREEQAKQLLDVLISQRMIGANVEANVVADWYARVAEGLLVRPQSHGVCRDAIDRALKLQPEHARARALRTELDAFPTQWRDHVRRLRDGALDARDKREAARRYLAIAQIHAAYAPKDPQIAQNIDKCLLLAPGHRPAIKFLERQHREEGQLPQLIELLTKQAEGIRAVDAAVELWLFIVVLMAERGASGDELTAVYERVRKLDPRNAAAIQALTEWYLTVHRYDQAAIVMEAFVRESTDAAAKRTTLQQLVHLYEVELNDPVRALGWLEQLRVVDDSDDVIVRLADMHESQGNIAKAVDALDVLARPRRRGEEPNTLERLLDLSMQLPGGDDRAVSYARRLYVVRPSARLEEKLVALADKLGRPQEAARALAEAAAQQPPTEARRMRMAAAAKYMAAGDRAQARTCAEAVLQLDEDDAQAQALLESLLAQDASPQDRVQMLERKLRRAQSATEKRDARLALADVFVRLRRHEEAMGMLRLAHDDDSADIEVLDKMEQLLRSGEQDSHALLQLRDTLRARVRAESTAGNHDEQLAARLRLARLLDERLGVAAEAAEEYLALFHAQGEQPEMDVLRALERSLAAGVRAGDIARALAPYYASIGSWRRHVDVLHIQRRAAEQPAERSRVARQAAAVFAAELQSPGEAMESWGSVIIDEPGADDARVALRDLAGSSGLHARHAEILRAVAQALGEGALKSSLLEERAALLQGVLNDDAAAIEAHKTVLLSQPRKLESIDALIGLYAQSGDIASLASTLQQRLLLSNEQDAPAVAARLGLLLVEHDNDSQRSRSLLEQAVDARQPVQGATRVEALRRLTGLLAKLGDDDAGLVAVRCERLHQLGEQLEGIERANVLVEEGDLLRTRLQRYADALTKYEAAVRADTEHASAWSGLREMLHDEACPTPLRQGAGRALAARAGLGGAAGRPSALAKLYALETSLQGKRALVQQCAQSLLDDAEQPEEAFELLLQHARTDAEDEPTRRQLESLGVAVGQLAPLLDLYRHHRRHPDGELGLRYAHRAVELAERMGDHAAMLETLGALAERTPQDVVPWQRMLAVHERLGDAPASLACLEEIASRSSDDEKPQRLSQLADFAFDELDDAARGLDALRAARALRAGNDAILARLEVRLRSLQDEGPELVDVLQERASLQSTPSLKAGLLAELGRIQLALGQADGAAAALNEALRLERDGASTLQTTELLQRIAVRNDAAGLVALETLVEHHRAQRAWLPLVDSLDIAAQKRPQGEERAVAFDEISMMQETQLRVPQLAFMAACRALLESPSKPRYDRTVDLASRTGSLTDLIAVLEELADKYLQAGHQAQAVHSLAEALAVAESVADVHTQVRLAEAILQVSPGQVHALQVLERIHRTDTDQSRLIEVLQRRATSATDDATKRAAWLESARLQVTRGLDADAEVGLRQVLDASPNDADALLLLDDLYERTGNSASHAEVLQQRIAQATDTTARATLYARLSMLLLRRRGDPAGALDAANNAKTDAATSPDTRRAFELLLEHARSRGAPPLTDVAEPLGLVLRAQNDLAALAALLELRVNAEPDRVRRADLLMHAVEVQEAQQQASMAFMAACRAVKEAPERDDVRAAAERLAVATDSLEALAMVYEDVLDGVRDPAIRVLLHKRIAQLAEDGQDPSGARERLVAAVQAGANDLDTLSSLVRLTRDHGTPAQLAEALQLLAKGAYDQGDLGISKEAVAELADVYENAGDMTGAKTAASQLLMLDPNDRGARANLERLLQRTEDWPGLVAQLEGQLTTATSSDERGSLLARLAHVQLDRVRDLRGGVQSIQQLADTTPTSESVAPLAARGLVLMSNDARPEVRAWRAQLAQLLAPRYEAQQAWSDLVPVLRLCVDAETQLAARKHLWLRMIDIEEKLLQRPEQALITLSRALAEEPADASLRERAERLSVQLHDLEGLLGVYEDLLGRLGATDPLRIVYAERIAELYEGGTGEPGRAAELYEVAYQAMVAQSSPSADRQRVLERMERLHRVVGDPAKLSLVLRRRAELNITDVKTARGQLFEAATIESHGLHDHGAAIQSLRRLLEIAPSDLPALRALCEACEKQQRWSDLAEALERQLAVLGNTDPTRSLQERHRLGVVLDTHLHLPDEALVQFQAVLDVKPDHAETRNYLENRLGARQTGKFEGAGFLQASYEKTGDWQKAVDVLQAQANELERNGAAGRELKAVLVRIADLQQLKLASAGLAFMTLCRALRVDPTDAQLRVRLRALATEADVLDDYCEVLEDEATALDVAGKGVPAAELREDAASIYADAMRDVPRSIAAYEAVLHRQPGRVPPLEALSTLYPKAGRYADQEGVLRRRLMFIDDPSERLPLLIDLSAVLVDHLNRTDDASSLLKEVRTTDPSNRPARRMLIEIADQDGQVTSLRSLLEEELAACKALQDEDGTKQARLRLARLLTELNDVGAAIPLWEEVRVEQGTSMSTESFGALSKLLPTAERHVELKALYESALRDERDPRAVQFLTNAIADVLATHLGGKDEAVQRHLKILELEPGNHTSLDALRRLYFELGRYDDQVALIRKMMRMIADTKQLKDLRFELSEVLANHLDRRAEAVEMGRRILDIEPHSVDQLTRLAAILRTCDAHEELSDVLLRKAALIGGHAQVDCLLEAADVVELKLHRPRMAVAAYERVLQVQPQHDRAHERLTIIYEQNSEWQRLIALHDKRVGVVSDVGERVRLLREIAALYDEKLGQKSMAFLAACRAFREDYADGEVGAYMERVGLACDSADEVITVYDDALENLDREPRIIETHLRMAHIASAHIKDMSLAETHLRRALEHNARNEEALDALTSLYESNARWKDLVATYERRAELSSDQGVRIDWLRKAARTLDHRDRNVDGAIAMYRRILELDASEAQANRELVELLQREERFQALITALERQEELCVDVPGRVAVRMRIAAVWENDLKNADQAVATYRSIVDDDAGNVLALRALERLFTSLSRPDELLKVFEQLVASAPAPDERIRLLQKVAATHEESFEDFSSAIAAFDRILEVDPGHLPSIKNLERLLERTGQWERYIAMCAAHVRLGGDTKETVRLYMSMGDVYAKELGRSDKAEAMYNAALEHEPGSQPALHALGSLYERSGNWFNALEKLQQEAQLRAGQPEAVDVYHRIGKINEDMLLDVGSAEAAYKAALQIEPSHLPSIRSLRVLAKQRNDQDAQLRWLRAESQYTADDVERTNVHTATGVFLQELANLDEAAIEFEKALSITYDHLPAVRPLADITFRDEAWGRAEQLLDIIVDRAASTSTAQELCRQHYRLGYVCEKLSKQQKALKNYQRAYELDATYLPGLEGLAASLTVNGRYDDASKVVQAILIHHRDGLTDAEVVDYYQQLADLHFRLQQNDKALKNLDRSLELDSTHVPSLRLLATIFESERRYEDAYESLMRLQPLVSAEERVPLLIEIGKLAKTELEDPYRAIDAYEDANRQRPQDKDILAALLSLYRQSKQGPRAVEALEELVRIEPDEKQRVRLNHSLGEVWRDEVKNEERALQYFNAALDLDPKYIKAFEALEAMLAQAEKWPLLADNYVAMLRRLPQADPKGVKTVLFKNLGDLYRFRIKDLAGATAAYRFLTSTHPDNVEFQEVYADLLSRDPQHLDAAAHSWQRALQLSPDKLARPLHELVRIHAARNQTDRVYVSTSILKVLGDLQGREPELLASLSKQVPAQAKRGLNEKLWEAMMHPQTRTPLANISTILWRAVGSQLMRQPKDLQLDKKKVWDKTDLDAPVLKYFANQLKFVRTALGVGGFDFYEHIDGAETMMPMPLEQPSFMIGRAHPLMKETQARVLWFHIARQLAGLRASFLLPRLLGAERFQMLVDAAVRSVDARYPQRGDPKQAQEFERLLQRIGPTLPQALAPHVQELLASKQAVMVTSYLEGIEHTAIRAAVLLVADLDVCVQLLKQPDTSLVPLSFSQKVRELVLFVASDEHAELRVRLGTAIGSS
jgi:golgin subfamily B member 1